MIKLVTSPTSPYGRKIRVLLAEASLEFELIKALPWEPDTRISHLNPLGKIPVLVLEDGTTLYDSRVIGEYLCGLGPGSHLMPKEFYPRIMVKRFEALADGICDAGQAILVERRRAATCQDDTWILRQQNKIENAVDVLSEDLGENPWFVEGALSMADIAINCALGFLLFRFPEMNYLSGYQNLKSFTDRLSHRKSFLETVPA